jgi:ubiquinone/menaquinone biosynthesis C-methylase UbiE
MTGAHWESTNPDIGFLRECFRDIDGPILELACGTGRAAVPLAEAGYQVHGLDASRDMLAVAAAKKEKMAPEASERLFLTAGNMRDFTFPIQFSGIYSTFRSFQNLLTPEDQETCLRCIYRPLRTDGLLVLNLFDPRYELLVPGECPAAASSRSLVHPISGNRVMVEVLQRVNDVLRQCLTEVWRFTEFGPDNTTVLRQEEEILELRWTFRQEMRYLLRLCGFRVVAEYSDFEMSPPNYGQERVWIATKSV